MGVVGHWNLLPRVVDVPSLVGMLAMLDGALSILMQQKVSLSVAVQLELDDL